MFLVQESKFIYLQGPTWISHQKEVLSELLTLYCSLGKENN